MRPSDEGVIRESQIIVHRALHVDRDLRETRRLTDYAPTPDEDGRAVGESCAGNSYFPATYQIDEARAIQTR